MKFKSNLGVVIEELKEFQKPFIKIGNDSGSTIVKDAQFTTVENKLNVDKLSDSEDSALNEASYLEVRQGEPVDQNNVDEMLNRFIRDYLEEVFK